MHNKDLYKAAKEIMLTAVANQVSPHVNAESISFKHRKTLSAHFNDILGLHDVDHLSIDLIDPNGVWISLSSSPSMVFNLLSQKLWRYDMANTPAFFNTHRAFNWQQAYHPQQFSALKQVKQDDFDLNAGLCLVRKLESFTLIYSFATKSLVRDFLNSYQHCLDDLLMMGDYCYKNLKLIFQQYHNHFIVPSICSFQTIVKVNEKHRHLRLINNT